MLEDTLFHLLTEEYTLILAQNSNDFQYVRKLRQEVYSSKFSLSNEYLKSKGYIFSKEDEQSFIYLLYHNPTDTYVGTIRVYFINTKTPLQKLPMQEDANVLGISYSVDTEPICEVSRLALSDKLPKHNKLSQLQLSTYLSLLLMVGSRSNYFLYHYSTVYSIMERSLDIILQRQGVKFNKIGETVDHYGIRTPYAKTGRDLMIETEKTMRKLTLHHFKNLCKNKVSFWKFIDSNPYLERKDIHLDRICKLFEEYGDDVPLELLMGDI